jgi:hypothetical protein
LAGFAAVAAGGGDAEAAGRLWGVFERLVEETEAAYAPSERSRYERGVAEVAGPEFTRSVRAGRVLPLARAVEDALSLD